ncbi:MAG TPA: FAD-binding oxidoreductase, partial [Steroidobacteraceae bacterium]|nr:FAD-binding oxidoreductase [Steroidobacteraceae bacterium]
MEHVRSYYAATAHASPLREPLRGEVTADVCVVGGGIAGCSTALHLAERGYKVVLLEGQRIGWGASGRSGGQAIFGFAAGQDKLVRQVGQETARRMFDVSVDALDLLKERVARHAIDCDLHWGQAHVAIKPRHETELKAWREELERDYGYTSLRWL